MDELAPGLVVTAEGPIRLIELNRPEQRNAASEALHTALAGVWDRLAADEAVRAVVLTGRGRAFSAGGDFHVMTRVQRDEAFREQNIAEARRIITGMVGCPVMAAVNGPAVGLGCSLALLSDLVLIVGLARARELLFLGERVSATEAVRLGLANRVVPGDKLLAEAMDLARRLATLPAGALQGTKRAVNLHLEHAMATVMEPALDAERDSMHSPEHVAIVARLIAKSR